MATNQPAPVCADCGHPEPTGEHQDGNSICMACRKEDPDNNGYFAAHGFNAPQPAPDASVPAPAEVMRERKGAWPLDIRDPDDEMVATGFVHIERMDDNAWWIGIYTADGKCVHVNFWTKRAKIYSRMDVDHESDYWASRFGSSKAALEAEAGLAERVLRLAGELQYVADALPDSPLSDAIFYKKLAYEDAADRIRAAVEGRT